MFSSTARRPVVGSPFLTNLLASSATGSRSFPTRSRSGLTRFRWTSTSALRTPTGSACTTGGQRLRPPWRRWSRQERLPRQVRSRSPARISTTPLPPCTDDGAATEADGTATEARSHVPRPLPLLHGHELQPPVGGDGRGCRAERTRHLADRGPGALRSTRLHGARTLV